MNVDFDYKSAISNGLYFNLAARVARYTGDDSCAQHAAETFDWMLRVGLIDASSFDVYDGAYVEYDCRDINRAQFSYNVAVLLHGAAFIIAFKPACEGGVSNVPADGCTGEMLAFKGFGAPWMATTAQQD
ncbi:glycosyl hydrolase family 76-domain-containing protein [Diaporthe sp. PMI_573]|nr:glycosyl hydrolase family 76-domain-containing protein [Diaporthaceae sp. PMI_573]